MDVKNIGMTGSQGLMGNHLLPILIKNKYNIVATAKKKNSKFKELDFSKSLSNRKLDDIFGQVDCLIHMAAVLPNKDETNSLNMKKVNYNNTKILIDWAFKKNILFIFFSTYSVYEKKIQYTILKKKIENYLLKNKKKKYLILRPSSIYGYTQRNETLLLNKINEIKKSKIVKFYKPLSTRFNFIHAHDVCRALIFLIKKNKTGIFNVVNERYTSIRELIKILKLSFNLKKKNILILKKNKSYISKKTNFIKNYKIKKLGWKTKINLCQGIKKSFIKKEIIL